MRMLNIISGISLTNVLVLALYTPSIQTLGSRFTPSNFVAFCTGPSLTGVCVRFPIVDGACTELINGLAILNQQIESANVPFGFLCTLFKQGVCESDAEHDDEVGLVTGLYNSLAAVPGVNGMLNFTAKAATFTCAIL